MKNSTARQILVITDDKGTGDQLRLAFKQNAPDWNLEVVRSRKEIKSSDAAKLVLLDLMLSHEAPSDVLRWLRSQPGYTEVPVFVLGSAVVNHYVSEAYTLGANGCLLKESEPQGVAKIVRAIATYANLIAQPACACPA